MAFPQVFPFLQCAEDVSGCTQLVRYHDEVRDLFVDLLSLSLQCVQKGGASLGASGLFQTD